MIKRFSFIEVIIVLVITAILSGFAIPEIMSIINSNKEKILTQNTKIIRDALQQFRFDRRSSSAGIRYPKTLAHLVSAGYLREIPIDPFTQERQWEVRPVGASPEVETNWFKQPDDNGDFGSGVIYSNGGYDNSPIDFTKADLSAKFNKYVSCVKGFWWRDPETEELQEAYIVVLENSSKGNQIIIVQFDETTNKFKCIAKVSDLYLSSSITYKNDIDITNIAINNDNNNIYFTDTRTHKIFVFAYDVQRYWDNVNRSITYPCAYITKGVYSKDSLGGFSFVDIDDSTGDDSTGSGSGDYELKNPGQAFYYKNYIYVADKGNNKLNIFDVNWNQIGIVKNSGANITYNGVNIKDLNNANAVADVSSPITLQVVYSESYKYLVENNNRGDYLYIQKNGGITVLRIDYDETKMFTYIGTYNNVSTNLDMSISREIYGISGTNIEVYSMGKMLSDTSNSLIKTLTLNGHPTKIDIFNGKMMITDSSFRKYVYLYRAYGGIYDIRSVHDDYGGDTTRKKFHHRNVDRWLYKVDGTTVEVGIY